MISYRIDCARRLVEVTGGGTLSAREISECHEALRTDPAFEPDFALLVDFRAASLSALKPPEVRRHAESDPFGPESPRAMLVDNDADYRIIQLFWAYSEWARHTGPVRPFRDLDSARTWIEEVRGAKP
jgi:hypothetical protein